MIIVVHNKECTVKSSDSSKALSLLQNLQQHGGIKILESDNFDLRDGAEKIFKNCKITNAEELMSVVLMVHAFGNSDHVVFLFEIGLRLGILTKTNLIQMYLMQSEAAHKYGPILTFEKMARISQFAFPIARGKENIVPVQWITKEEMLALANQVISISHQDLYTIFQQWFYRTEVEIPLSKEFFAYWWKVTGDSVNNVDGKIASLLAIAFQKKYPEEVSLDETIKRFASLSHRRPESHGVFRYLSLCFWIAGKNEAHKQKVTDVWVRQIEDMIRGGKSLYRGAQLSIEFFISEKNISESVKTKALKKINRTAKSVAKSYTNLVADAQKFVDEL